MTGMPIKPNHPAHHSPPSHHAPAHSTQAHPHPHRPSQGTSRADTFDRLDRNNNGRIDRKEVVVSRNPAQKPAHLHGDRNHDGSISRSEFNRLTRHMDGFDHSPGHRAASERQAVFKMPEGRSATIRTHAAGLVKGRVQPGDKFIVTHQRGPWVFGHVKGHPTRQGWVLRESLPQRALRHATPAELSEGASNPRDYRDAGISFTTGQDKKVLQLMQQGVEHAGTRIGYTTPVRPKDPTKPITLYANFPCRPENVLMHGGKPMQIPPGTDVKFRYTPDGKTAVVLYMMPGHKHGVWAMVPMSDLVIPKGTMGANAPIHPLRG